MADRGALVSVGRLLGVSAAVAVPLTTCSVIFDGRTGGFHNIFREPNYEIIAFTGYYFFGIINLLVFVLLEFLSRKRGDGPVVSYSYMGILGTATIALIFTAGSLAGLLGYESAMQTIVHKLVETVALFIGWFGMLLPVYLVASAVVSSRQS